MKTEDRILPLNMLRRVAVSHFPGERGDDCPPCDLRERNPSRHHLPVRGWGSARTSPEERGPIEAPPVHGISPTRPVKMVGLSVTCEGVPGSLLPLSRYGGDGCSICDLHEGAGTTLVDQMRPASGWRCRCSKFRSGEARNGTSFGIEQMRNFSPTFIHDGSPRNR